MNDNIVENEVPIATFTLNDGNHLPIMTVMSFPNGGNIVNGVTSTIIPFPAGHQIVGPVELFFDNDDIFHAAPIQQLAGVINDAISE